jgi:mannose-6-phosphate isomerase-like protein (cupin superfamily)
MAHTHLIVTAADLARHRLAQDARPLAGAPVRRASAVRIVSSGGPRAVAVASRAMPEAADDLTFGKLDLDNEDRFQSLRRELGVSSFGINLITLQPRERGRIHAHERQEEVYLVIEGQLTLVVEGWEHALGRGELVRVAPPVRRQLVNRGPGRLALLALGGTGEHTGRDGRAWASWDEGGPGRPPQEVPSAEDLPAG